MTLLKSSQMGIVRFVFAATAIWIGFKLFSSDEMTMKVASVILIGGGLLIFLKEI